MAGYGPTPEQDAYLRAIAPPKGVKGMPDQEPLLVCGTVVSESGVLFESQVCPSLSADLISCAVSDNGARLMRSGMVGVMIRSAARIAARADAPVTLQAHQGS